MKGAKPNNDVHPQQEHNIMNKNDSYKVIKASKPIFLKNWQCVKNKYSKVQSFLSVMYVNQEFLVLLFAVLSYYQFVKFILLDSVFCLGDG